MLQWDTIGKRATNPEIGAPNHNEEGSQGWDLLVT